MRQHRLADGSFDKCRKKDPQKVISGGDGPDHSLARADRSNQAILPGPRGAGRRQNGFERMLRIHFLLHWFELSDPATEEVLYDSWAMRQFVGIDLGQESEPDETTICEYQRLMERHNLGD